MVSVHVKKLFNGFASKITLSNKVRQHLVRGATLPIYIGKTSYFLYMEAKLTTLVNRPDPKSFFGVCVGGYLVALDL